MSLFNTLSDFTQNMDDTCRNCGLSSLHLTFSVKHDCAICGQEDWCGSVASTAYDNTTSLIRLSFVCLECLGQGDE
jgi:hypothetical protein